MPNFEKPPVMGVDGDPLPHQLKHEASEQAPVAETTVRDQNKELTFSELNEDISGFVELDSSTNSFIIKDPDVLVAAGTRLEQLTRGYYTEAYFEDHPAEKDQFFKDPEGYARAIKEKTKVLQRDIMAQEIAEKVVGSKTEDHEKIYLKIREILEKQQGDYVEQVDKEQPYTVSDKIPRENILESLDDFYKKESKLERPIDTRLWNQIEYETVSAETKETIRLADVVGGYYGESWFTDDQNDRGKPEYTYRIVQMFQDGSLNISDQDPIRVEELDGKYYISADGRHRIAALKILGITEVPALVTKIRKKDL